MVGRRKREGRGREKGEVGRISGRRIKYEEVGRGSKEGMIKSEVGGYVKRG